MKTIPMTTCEAGNVSLAWKDEDILEENYGRRETHSSENVVSGKGDG